MPGTLLIAQRRRTKIRPPMAPKQKIVVVGAGPVGSLAALYAAQRGHEVEIYELRPGESMYLFFSHQIQGSLSRDTTTDEPEGDGSMHSCCTGHTASHEILRLIAEGPPPGTTPKDPISSILSGPAPLTLAMTRRSQGPHHDAAQLHPVHQPRPLGARHQCHAPCRPARPARACLRRDHPHARPYDSRPRPDRQSLRGLTELRHPRQGTPSLSHLRALTDSIPGNLRRRSCRPQQAPARHPRKHAQRPLLLQPQAHRRGLQGAQGLVRGHDIRVGHGPGARD